MRNTRKKWIYIDGCKSIYKIRSNGIIVSTEYQGKKRKTEHEMLGGIDADGYRIVALTHNGRKKTYKVHRVVAQYFIPNPFDKPEVNHKDGNKINNNIENLEWVYTFENVQHAMEHDLRYTVNSEEYIHLVCQLLESNEYSISDIHRISGVSKETIRKIKNKTHFVWISSKYNIDNFDIEKKYSHTQREMMSDDLVYAICNELVRNTRTVSEISRMFDVSITSVDRILSGITRPDISSQYDLSKFNIQGINQFVVSIKNNPNIYHY